MRSREVQIRNYHFTNNLNPTCNGARRLPCFAKHPTGGFPPSLPRRSRCPRHPSCLQLAIWVPNEAGTKSPPSFLRAGGTPNAILPREWPRRKPTPYSVFRVFRRSNILGRMLEIWSVPNREHSDSHGNSCAGQLLHRHLDTRCRFTNARFHLCLWHKFADYTFLFFLGFTFDNLLTQLSMPALIISKLGLKQFACSLIIPLPMILMLLKDRATTTIRNM